MQRGRLYCGTSGFAYAQWRPGFYPEKTPPKKFLSYYATRLNVVEINYTFRRLPTSSVLKNWISETQPGFVFAIKAHQKITHIDRLEPTEFTSIFFSAIDPLRVTGRLGPVLVQLPPSLSVDEWALDRFLRATPKDLRLVFEFRNKNCFNEAIYQVLRFHRVALCMAESEKLVTPPLATADFMYFRLRKYEYTAEEINAIRIKAHHLLDEGKDVFLFFKHEDSPIGALSAERLLKA